MNVFITGSTGFLAGELAVLLSKRPQIRRLYCLVRANDAQKAWSRLQQVFQFHGDAFDTTKVVPVVGDLADSSLAEKLCRLKDLGEVDTVIHAAADTSFAPSSTESVEKINIDGTQQILKWAQSLPNLRVTGIACHIGSQLTDMAPLMEALDRVLALAGVLMDKGVALQHLDLGGGLGIRYNEEQPPEPGDYVRAILGRLQTQDPRCQRLRLVFEPGRATVRNAHPGPPGGHTQLPQTASLTTEHDPGAVPARIPTRVLHGKGGSVARFAAAGAWREHWWRPGVRTRIFPASSARPLPRSPRCGAPSAYGAQHSSC